MAGEVKVLKHLKLLENLISFKMVSQITTDFVDFENISNNAWTDFKFDAQSYTKVYRVELHCNFETQN